MLKRFVSLLVILPILGVVSLHHSIAAERASESSSARKFENSWPIKLVVQGSLLAGQDIQVTVTLNQIVSADTSVAISASDPSVFSNLPAQVTVSAGQMSKTFTVHLVNSGSTTLSASEGGMVAYAALAIGAAKA